MKALLGLIMLLWGTVDFLAHAPFAWWLGMAYILVGLMAFGWLCRTGEIW